MMHLLPHHRIHIPNGLAMFAALLLLISSATGFETNQEANSSAQELTSSANIETNKGDGINDAAEQKRRGLNIGLLLFRR
jgi:hypothetical protein